MNKKVRAIFINSSKKTTEVISFEMDDYKSIAKAIGCEIISVCHTFNNKDSIFIDDEGLLKEVNSGFILDNWRHPVAGNALILGTDDEGESVDAVTSIQYINKCLHFVTDEQIKSWQKEALSTPPRVMFFEDKPSKPTLSKPDYSQATINEVFGVDNVRWDWLAKFSMKTIDEIFKSDVGRINQAEVIHAIGNECKSSEELAVIMFTTARYIENRLFEIRKRSELDALINDFFNRPKSNDEKA